MDSQCCPCGNPLPGGFPPTIKKVENPQVGFHLDNIDCPYGTTMMIVYFYSFCQTFPMKYCALRNNKLK